MKTLIKNCLIVIIIVIVIAVGGFMAFKLFFKNPISDKAFNTLPDGTYSCELMYNGKSFDDDETIEAFIKKISSYDSSINRDYINISDFRKGLMDEFGIPYIIKENNVVKLNIKNGNPQTEFAIYDISSNQLNLNTNFFDTSNDDVLNLLETSFNKIVHVKQNKDSYTFNNFGYILIFPTIYNNYKKNMSSDKIEDIDYDTYNDLGELVCSSNISSNDLNETSQETNSDNKYLGKYIGDSGDLKEMSYIVLDDNNQAKLSMNNCEGFSLYNATFKIKYDEDLASNMLYITSLSIMDGIEMNIPDTLMLQMKDNELLVLSGYDSNLFDCSRATKLIKSN